MPGADLTGRACGGAACASAPANDLDDILSMPLPALRDELRMCEAAEDAGWAGGYLVHDPVRNSYFRLPLVAVRALGCWKAGTVGGVLECLHNRHGIEAAPEDILELAAFLEHAGLLAPEPRGWEKLWQQAWMSRPGPLRWLLHNYLFFRVPLVRPQRFLEATFPYVRWLGSRAGLLVLAILFLAGAWLTLRQWDEFVTTFMGFVNMEGVILFGCTIILVKVAHELGHAYIATRFGVRVPTMGVAFLVMVPMLYTDVTDAWKVKDRRARLLIGMGGMLVEMALAGIALFLWAILPEGPGRTAAFFVATTSLLTTLLVNMSPFMRFDGYHILADLLRVHNLQPRAFALGLWKLRQVLFGLDEPPPEEFAPRMQRLLIVYAYATWVYRFFLFAGIALIVYHAFPKVLGIFLAAVEVGWFIVLPVWRVISRWWEEREKIMEHGKPWRPLGIVLLVLVVLFAPVWRSVSLPAVLLPAEEQELHAPEAARVVRIMVRPGQRVQKGQVLAELASERLDYETRAAKARLELVERRLARMVASQEDLRLIEVLRRERQQLKTRLAGLAERRRRLVLTAEVDGVVRSEMRGLQPGIWVSPDDMLLRIVAEGGVRIASLAPETVVGRLQEGAGGKFVPDDPGAASLPVRLAEIGTARQHGRDILYLSSVHGGPVAAERDPQDGTVHTRVGMFPLRLVPDMAEEDSTAMAVAGKARATKTGAGAYVPMPCTVACRGRVVVEARAESLAGRLARRVVSVILRESGF